MFASRPFSLPIMFPRHFLYNQNKTQAESPMTSQTNQFLTVKVKGHPTNHYLSNVLGFQALIMLEVVSLVYSSEGFYDHIIAKFQSVTDTNKIFAHPIYKKDRPLLTLSIRANKIDHT